MKSIIAGSIVGLLLAANPASASAHTAKHAVEVTRCNGSHRGDAYGTAEDALARYMHVTKRIASEHAPHIADVALYRNGRVLAVTSGVCK